MSREMVGNVLDERGFVFLDGNNRPFLVRLIDGDPWLCYWNDETKSFVTLRKTNQAEILSFPQNLSEEHQNLYRNGGRNDGLWF